MVVTGAVGIPEVALEFKHESELPAWMTVGLEYWGLPCESVILEWWSVGAHFWHTVEGTYRKVMLDPAGRSGVQVRPPAGRSLPMKAMAGASEGVNACLPYPVDGQIRDQTYQRLDQRG